MCEYGTWKKVKVWIPPDLDCVGEGKWKFAKIDSCIAPIVRALQRGGINMRSSCCGHEKHRGRIDLQDGRIIWIDSSKRVHCYIVKRDALRAKRLMMTEAEIEGEK
jgi:hypothetical protein